MNWSHVASTFSLINFAVAAVLGISALRDTRKFAAFGNLGAFLFVLACLSVIAATAGQAGGLGWSSSQVQQLAIVAAISGATLPCFYWFGIKPMLFPASFVAALILGVQQFDVFGDASGHLAVSGSKHAFLVFHIVGALMGQVFALGASLAAILYLWQQRALKQKLLGELTARMPSLEALAKVLMACLWSGFLFLSAALVSGAVYLDFSPTTSQMQQTAKLVWSIGVWAWYSLTLSARYVLRWPTRRIAQMGLGGLVLLALASFGFSFFSAGGG